MKKLTTFRVTRSQIVAALLIGSSIVVAYASTVTLPNTFTAGTQVSATQVNANFTAVKTAVDDNFSRLPRVWAHTDDDPFGTSLTAGLTEVNSIAIDVPSNGFVTISGSAFVNNDGAAADFVLLPRVDGANVLGHSFLGYFSAAAGGAGAAELFSLGYTITVPITAGAHTVSQLIGPESGSIAFFYNKNNLTVTFFPGSQGSVTPTITPLFRATGDGSSVDRKIESGR